MPHDDYSWERELRQREALRAAEDRWLEPPDCEPLPDDGDLDGREEDFWKDHWRDRRRERDDD